MKVKRFLRLYVCDYDKNIVCSLYDSESDILGQAYNIFIDSDRNSYKELSFNLPPKVMTENGSEDNFRLKFLIADYQILAVTKDRTDPEGKKEIKDYFIISEPRITHNPLSKEISVTCKHNSQMLTHKNLELEFSDEEGNNVATADVLLSIILDGTGWSVGEVYDFKEDDGVTSKVRTLVASAKTGALKLISMLCEKFDAKPIYHSEEKTVDLLPLNPFSKKESDVIADIIKNNTGVLELNYRRNLKSVSRTLNTDNIVTKFYVRGSYGDYQTGICTIQTCSHTELTLSIDPLEISTTNEYWFEPTNGNRRYFISDNQGPFYWSNLDLLSRSYVYTVNNNIVTAYELTSTPQTFDPKGLKTSIPTEPIINNVPYLMNFSYYRKVGLLKDNQFQYLAQYQYSMPRYYKQSTEASEAKNKALQELSDTAESSTGFLRLAATSQNINGNLRLNILQNQGDNGILYRSDYDAKKKNFFSWYVADQIKPNGDAVNGGSKVLIVHDTTPPTWEFAYVKEIYHNVDGQEELIVDDQGNPTHYIYALSGNEPSAIVLWQSYLNITNTDKIFLFCTNSMSGSLGTAMSVDESIVLSLNEKLKQETVPHDVIFTDTDATIRGTTYRSNEVNKYGWLYKYNKSGVHYSEGTLYYMNIDKNINRWREVIFADEMPDPAYTSYINQKMFFNNKTKTLWLGTAGNPDSWVQMCKDTEQEIARNFSYVYQQCKERDVAYKGWFERYEKTFSPALPKGNYAMKNEFGSYWLFTTTQNVTKAKYIYKDGHMYQDDDPEHVVPVKYYPFDTLDFPIQNILDNMTVTTGNISETGVDIDDLDETPHIRTNYLRAYTDINYDYSFSGGTNYRVYFYDQNQRYINKQTLSSSGSFKTPKAPDVPEHPDGNYVGQTYYLRLVYEGTSAISGSLKIQNCDNLAIAGTDTFYTILPAVNTQGGFEGKGENLGINNLMTKFRDLAEEAYYQSSGAVTPDGGYIGLWEKAQERIKNENRTLVETLGDLLRESTWQDSSYAEGDEDRLYSDAMDTFKEISEPEATYEITYLEPYGSENTDYSLTPETNFFSQDVETTDAVHLIDEDLDEDRWAYIDKVRKAYDFTEKTTIQINTKLTTIGQRSFTDVMSHIVDVAKDFKAKQTIYDRAENITSSGEILGEKIKGTLDAYKTLISGGASNWYTDEKGNIVFEAVDGNSAMMLSGAGLMIANTRDEYGDWQWQTAATGYGIVADAISTGILSAVRIEAGSITTDKLSSNFGEELDISSNETLNLFATVDGKRPSGSLETAHPNEGDSWISIGSKTEDHDAFIAIKSGGNITLDANSSINITSAGQITIGSGTLESELASKGSLQSSKVQYYLSESTESLIGGEWQDTAPEWENDMYMWTRTELTYADGNVEYMPSENGTCIAGAKGDSGNPATNTATVVLYKRGDSVPTAPGSLTYNFSTGEVTGTLSGWSKTFPSGSDPCYSIVGYAADTANTTTISSWSNPILTVQNGEDGDSSYTYIRYATDDQGTGMTTTPTADTKFIGICVTNSDTAPTTASSYTWSKYAGDDGVGITVTERYAVNNSDTDAPTTGWTTDPSELTIDTDHRYLWNWEYVIGSDGATQVDRKHVVYRLSTDGEPGRGITGVTNWYYTTNITDSSLLPAQTDGNEGNVWVAIPVNPSENARYLWNYEKVSYTSGDPTRTPPCIIGNYAADGQQGPQGVGVTSVVTKYLLSGSPTSEPEDDQGNPIPWEQWLDTVPEYVTGKYYWSWTRIFYSDGTSSQGTKMSEYGMNSSIITAADAKKMAKAITDGTDYDGVSYTKFYNKMIENTGVTVSEKDLLMNSQGSMFLNAGGGIFIAASGSDEEIVKSQNGHWGAGSKFTNPDYPYLKIHSVLTLTSGSAVTQIHNGIIQGSSPTDNKTLKSNMKSVEIIGISYQTTTTSTTPKPKLGTWTSVLPKVNSTTKIYLWVRFTLKCIYTDDTTGNAYIINRLYQHAGSNPENVDPVSVSYKYGLTSNYNDTPSGDVGYSKTSGSTVKPNNAIVINQSGIAVASNGNVSIQAGGTFTVDSGNFSISSTGDVTMKGTITTGGGDLAGWAIEPNYLHSGSSNTYVGLDSGSTIEEKAETPGTSSGYYLTGNTITNPFAMWAGKTDPYLAPFSVQRDGAIKFKQAKMGNWTFNNDALERRDTAGHIVISSDYIAGGPPSARLIGTPYSNWTYLDYWKLTPDGMLECKQGKLGEWNLDTYRISNSSGSNYVAIDAGSTVLLYSYYVQYDEKREYGDGTIEYRKNGTVIASGTQEEFEAAGILFYHDRTQTKSPPTDYDWIYYDENGTVLPHTETTPCFLWAGAEEPKDAVFYLKRDGSLKLTGSGSFDIDLTNFKINSENKTFTTGEWTLNDAGFIYRNANGSSITSGITGFRIYCISSYGFYFLAETTGGEGGFYISPSLALCPFRSMVSQSKPTLGDSSHYWDTGYITNIYGTIQGSSSKEVKHNIKSLSSVGEMIDKLNPVSFTYNDDEKNETRFGLIHEDTINVLPEICVGNDSTNSKEKAIRYTDLIPILLKEIQDLRKRVKELEDKLG